MLRFLAASTLFTILSIHELPGQMQCASAGAPMTHARVTIDLGNGAKAVFAVRVFDLGAHPGEVSVDSLKHASVSPVAVHFVKNADSSTSELVRRSASGDVLPEALVEVLDSSGVASMTVRLADVRISSDRLTLSNARATLAEQRIAEQEAISQTTADYQDAQRELATAEQLGKTRVTTPLELARARDRAAQLGRRLDFAKQRQAMVQREFDAQGFIDEELTLQVGRFEIANRD